mmetsp:Transcript_40180/g.92967  ORF Transcript_40180/g.92967 Transcript_40180/m.92967 type:complete len:220 (-) Transcript_40180:693-1352(-)
MRDPHFCLSAAELRPEPELSALVEPALLHGHVFRCQEPTVPAVVHLHPVFGVAEVELVLLANVGTLILPVDQCDGVPNAHHRPLINVGIWDQLDKRPGSPSRRLRFRVGSAARENQQPPVKPVEKPMALASHAALWRIGLCVGNHEDDLAAPRPRVGCPWACPPRRARPRRWALVGQGPHHSLLGHFLDKCHLEDPTRRQALQPATPPKHLHLRLAKCL